jgi:tetratricopeptide (TPR) repeat protein
LYGLYQAYLGKFAEARQAIDRAISVDRLNPRVWLGRIWIHYWAGEYADALDATERIWSENPNFASPETRSYFRFICNLELGRYDLARKYALAVGEKLEREWELAIVAQRDGDPGPGLGWLEQVERSQTYGASIANSRIALLAQLGRPTEALTALESEFARRNPYLMRIQVDPLLKPLAAEPRFKGVLERIGLSG